MTFLTSRKFLWFEIGMNILIFGFIIAILPSFLVHFFEVESNTAFISVPLFSFISLIFFQNLLMTFRGHFLSRNKEPLLKNIYLIYFIVFAIPTLITCTLIFATSIFRLSLLDNWNIPLDPFIILVWSYWVYATLLILTLISTFFKPKSQKI
jgi:hypothetical protein